MQRCIQLTGTNRSKICPSKKYANPTLLCIILYEKRIPVAIAEGSHPFPYRTRQLSPPAPMVLGFPGRADRCRYSLYISYLFMEPDTGSIFLCVFLYKTLNLTRMV